MREPKSKSSNWKVYLILGTLGLSVFILGFLAFSPYSPYSYWWLPDKPASPEVDISAFSVYDVSTELDVSNTTKCSVWIPLASENVALWDEEDYLDLDLYNETISEELASDIEIDLSNISVIFFEIGSDDTPEYANMFWLCGAGGNFEYSFPAFNQSEAILFNVIDDTYNEITVVNHTTDGTYYLLYGVPYPDTTVQAPLYDPRKDTLKDWNVSDPLTLYTDCFGFQFIFNNTIGEELDDPTHVNFTISEDILASVIYDNDSIYIIFHEIQGFFEAPSGLFYTIEYGANIKLIDVDAVRIEIPEGELGTFSTTKISDIAS